MTTRRNFLRYGFISAAAGLGAGTAASVSASPVKAPAQYDETFDLVIIGAGGAGLSAAAHAGELGLSAVVLEKNGLIAGSSMVCDGKYSAADTADQRAEGIHDSEEKFVEDLLRVGQGQNNPDVVKSLVKALSVEFKWLTDRGVKSSYVGIATGMSVPRAHNFNPAEVLSLYQKTAREKGIEVRFSTDAKRLLWDFEKNRISGVSVRTKAGEKRIGARYGVLLATGGFARNSALCAKYNPAIRNVMAMSGAGTDGDGILMAQAYGADFLNPDVIKATYGFTPSAKSIKDKSQVYYVGAIIVNKDGKRFVNESLSYKLLGDAALKQPEGKSFQLFDHAMMKKSLETDAREQRFWGMIDKEGKTPFGYVGKTLADVAKQAGIDPAVLEATVREYNELAPKGLDPLGRKSLGSGFGTPLPLTEGPFILMPTTAVLLSTYCGLKTDPQTRVIDIFNERIPGLYAAGEVMGGVHGAAYMTGTGFGKALAFGRLAAEAAASDKGN
ncbi:flavocytochrome c [uncultured Sutterella sp.]|uniref:FAD-dependent oxidoreductase n=1 Tax=uncultured Sutterella sp. TaxID=286133 RepID=UPI0026076AFE|nr:flavocytochrome c [uncultured Sutterella sp.]